MTTLDPEKWQELNDCYITAAVAWVRALLAERIPQPPPVARKLPKPKRGLLSWLFGNVEDSEKAEEAPKCSVPAEPAWSVADAMATLMEAQEALEAAGTPSTVTQLAQRFGLSQFEQNVLLLCLAFELESHVGWMCGLIQDKPHRPFPTFGLAMTLFHDSDWGAIPPHRPIRRARLVDFRHPAGTPLFGAELRLEETVLHYLRGVSSLDSRLASFASPISHYDGKLSQSQQATVDVACQMLSERGESPMVVQLLGGDSNEARHIASAMAQVFHWRLFGASVECLPTSAADYEDFAHLWQRDSALFGLALVIDVQDSGSPGDASRLARLLRLMSNVNTPLLVATRERLNLTGAADLCVEVAGPSVEEQFAMWEQEFPKGLSNPDLLAGELSRQFTLDRVAARESIAAVLREKSGKTAAGFRKLLWQECRVRTRPRLEGLAQRIDVKANWEDMVLSRECEALLKQIRGQVRSRWRVYDGWGLAQRMNRGLGISALFAGESGTGKTMAAEVIANELNLDLYRVDLSSVVNKYIGETEKHLRRLFDAFESCGAILFFDECDALFGKRSEVKDSHDRYANIEINYLLQRLESYRGLAILATNNRGALDSAFLRRLRFVVTFAMPTIEERSRIWRHLLPATAENTPATLVPVAPLDYQRLAQFHFSGGSIQNVVLNAAFRAASRPDNNIIIMSDVLAAAKDEYLKLERPINESDFSYVEPEIAEAAA